jgi:hypothetical protein
MSIEAMKQALEVIEAAIESGDWQIDGACDPSMAIHSLYEAIAEAEKQEPVAIGEEWKPCVKLPIIVHVREQRKGETHVSTREGITPVKEDDLIMRGVAGEEYPIGRELFNRTYTFDTAPVHAIDMLEKHVQVSDKNRHEPVAWIVDGEIKVRLDMAGKLYFSETNVYTSPPKREWVGLTDEDIDLYGLDEGVTDNKAPAWLVTYARGIEAKLKEKNVPQP